jgi:hypothetical protein
MTNSYSASPSIAISSVTAASPYAVLFFYRDRIIILQQTGERRLLRPTQRHPLVCAAGDFSKKEKEVGPGLATMQF